MQQAARLRAALLVATVIVAATGCAGAPRSTPSAPAPDAAAMTQAAGAPTGIRTCDAYLERYRACHAMIGAYRAEQVEDRYQALRDKLMERVGTPEGRERAQAECRMLSEAMDAALEGRACTADAAD